MLKKTSIKDRFPKLKRFPPMESSLQETFTMVILARFGLDVPAGSGMFVLDGKTTTYHQVRLDIIFSVMEGCWPKELCKDFRAYEKQVGETDKEFNRYITSFTESTRTHISRSVGYTANYIERELFGPIPGPNVGQGLFFQ
jgi:hypothetical protein